MVTPMAKDVLFNHTRGLAEIQGGIPQSLRTHADEFSLADRFTITGVEGVGSAASFNALEAQGTQPQG